MSTSNYETAMAKVYYLCVSSPLRDSAISKLYSAFLLPFLLALLTNNQASLNMTLIRQYVGGWFESGKKKINMTDSYLRTGFPRM